MISTRWPKLVISTRWPKLVISTWWLMPVISTWWLMPVILGEADREEAVKFKASVSYIRLWRIQGEKRLLFLEVFRAGSVFHGFM